MTLMTCRVYRPACRQQPTRSLSTAAILSVLVSRQAQAALGDCDCGEGNDARGGAACRGSEAVFVAFRPLSPCPVLTPASLGVDTGCNPRPSSWEGNDGMGGGADGRRSIWGEIRRPVAWLDARCLLLFSFPLFRSLGRHPLHCIEEQMTEGGMADAERRKCDGRCTGGY